VRLLEYDAEAHTMLLELCEPGTTLRDLPEPEQDVVIAALLRRLWNPAGRARPGPCRTLATMLAHWTQESLKQSAHWTDPELTRRGLRLFEEMSQPSPDNVLLATDLHAGNVLRAKREPWLVIDPKPFVGDRAYDATQHLLNCRDRLHADPDGTIARFAALLEVDPLRVRSWLFARAAAEPREDWGEEWIDLVKALKP
jgi:streptomycin 6-kinase